MNKIYEIIIINNIILFLFCVFLFIVTLFIGIKRKKSNLELRTTYECGFLPYGNSRVKFKVDFYRVAIMFILFDVEAIFLVPWSISIKYMSKFEFFVINLFLFILVIGLFIEYIERASRI